MDRLLKMVDVRKITSLAKSTIYNLMDCGDFPRPLQVGAKAVRWRESEVAAWLESRPRSTGWQGGE